MTVQIPTKDQSYCDIGLCQHCSGYTEDERDPETCMHSCHDAQLRQEWAVEQTRDMKVDRVHGFVWTAADDRSLSLVMMRDHGCVHHNGPNPLLKSCRACTRRVELFKKWLTERETP